MREYNPNFYMYFFVPEIIGMFLPKIIGVYLPDSDRGVPLDTKEPKNQGLL